MTPQNERFTMHGAAIVAHQDKNEAFVLDYEANRSQRAPTTTTAQCHDRKSVSHGLGAHAAPLHATILTIVRRWHTALMSTLHRLLPLFARASAVDPSLVLATVVRSAGSTYAKPGAHMLIANDGEYAGLLSGGCLEGDLREHARGVADSGIARIVSYDMRGPDDQLFGLGAGCEGAMDIVLLRLTGATQWEPLSSISRALQRHESHTVGLVVSSSDPSIPLGSYVDSNGKSSVTALQRPDVRALLERINTPRQAASVALPTIGCELFLAPLSLPPRVLILGAGPDVRPVAEFATALGWRLTVVDHRPSYLEVRHFPPGCRLLLVRPEEIAAQLQLHEFSAAVVMSHHLNSDLAYLRALAHASTAYVGLLGPAARREKLLADLGEHAAALRPRLRAPVGLDIGARAPEAIALAIVAEVHAALERRPAIPFSQVVS
jgi:xanthine dehydrogenase accessory factor